MTLPETLKLCYISGITELAEKKGRCNSLALTCGSPLLMNCSRAICTSSTHTVQQTAQYNVNSITHGSDATSCTHLCRGVLHGYSVWSQEEIGLTTDNILDNEQGVIGLRSLSQ